MISPLYINGRFLEQPITGIQRFSYELCKALIKQGVNIIILAPKSIRNEYRFDCKIEQFGRFSKLLWEQIDLPRYLSKVNNPLLLNFGSPGPLFYSNRIVTLHDLSFYHHPEWFSWSYNLYYRTVTPIFIRRSRKVLTVSEWSKSEILKKFKFSPEKITVIPNAASDCFQPQTPKTPSHSQSRVARSQKPEASHQSPEARSQKPKASRQPFILSVASQDPRKNLDRLIRAYQSSRFKSEYQLTLVGKGDSIFKMKSSTQIHRYSIGYVKDDELSDLYAHASLFVYPSLYEGFGLPPLEAMAMGCPVILSDIPVFHEVFGDAAHYVDPWDVDSIKAGIEQVLDREDYRQELIQKGYRQAQNYQWEESARKLIQSLSSFC